MHVIKVNSPQNPPTPKQKLQQSQAKKDREKLPKDCNKESIAAAATSTATALSRSLAGAEYPD